MPPPDSPSAVSDLLSDGWDALDMVGSSEGGQPEEAQPIKTQVGNDHTNRDGGDDGDDVLCCHLCDKNFGSSSKGIMTHYALYHFRKELRRRFTGGAQCTVCCHCGRNFKANQTLVAHLGGRHWLIKRWLPQHVWTKIYAAICSDLPDEKKERRKKRRQKRREANKKEVAKFNDKERENRRNESIVMEEGNGEGGALEVKGEKSQLSKKKLKTEEMKR